ncbi:hypothetical protein ON010_g3225 [Phytophthora cinnamomi]|nr:hypothetical protein ON010_g3225 [Phytophthora cinnamomi]
MFSAKTRLKTAKVELVRDARTTYFLTGNIERWAHGRGDRGSISLDKESSDQQAVSIWPVNADVDPGPAQPIIVGRPDSETRLPALKPPLH